MGNETIPEPVWEDLVVKTYKKVGCMSDSNWLQHLDMVQAFKNSLIEENSEFQKEKLTATKRIEYANSNHPKHKAYTKLQKAENAEKKLLQIRLDRVLAVLFLKIYITIIFISYFFS